MIRATATILAASAVGAGGFLALHGVPGAVAASSSLVAAYAFDEGSGTTVTDASGNGNNGTVANTTWTHGGEVRRGVEVQRDEFGGDGSEFGVVAAVEWDDVGGVG